MIKEKVIIEVPKEWIKRGNYLQLTMINDKSEFVKSSMYPAEKVETLKSTVESLELEEGGVISRIRRYSGNKYPNKDSLQTMLYDNTKGDRPLKITQDEASHEWVVVWVYDKLTKPKKNMEKKWISTYGVSVYEGSKKVAEHKFKTKEEMETWAMEQEVKQRTNKKIG